MKIRFTLLAVLLSASLLWAHFYVPGNRQDRPVLLKGGDLHTMIGEIMPGTDILFENGRITEIGKGITPPENAEVIDITGKQVYPGLIDPVSTLGLVEIGAVRATRDNTEVGTVTPEVQTHIAYNPDSEIIPTVRSNGILTALIAPQGGVISGRSSLINLDGWTKEDAMEKENVGLHINWPSVSVVTNEWIQKTPEEQKKESAENRRKLEEAFTAARTYWKARRAGTQTKIDLRWEAMMPVFDKQMTVFINANDARQIEQAVNFIETEDLVGVIVGGKEAYRVAALLKKHKIPVILGVLHSLPMREDDDIDVVYKQPRLLSEVGVKFCLSYDHSNWSSRSLPFQAGQAVAYGLDKDIALRCLTLTTAEILGVADQIGSLEVGKKATLIVSDGDILDPVTHRVTHAFIEGRKVDLNNKQKQLYEKYRQKRYGE